MWSSGYYPDFWGYYGYGWSNVYVLPTGRDTTTITVETLIYDLTRNQLVWAATSETRDPKNLQDFVKDLVNAAVKRDEEDEARWVTCESRAFGALLAIAFAATPAAAQELEPGAYTVSPVGRMSSTWDMFSMAAT